MRIRRARKDRARGWRWALAGGGVYVAAACTLLAPDDSELTRAQSAGDAGRDVSVDAGEDEDQPADAAPDRANPCDELTCPADSECALRDGLAACVCGSGFTGEAGACTRFVSCDALHRAQPHVPSGVYRLLPAGSDTEVAVYCEMTAEGGGWTLILNQNTKFDAAAPASTDVCYESLCTSAAYRTVRLVADVLLDVSDAPIVGNTFSGRAVITAIDGTARGKTLHQLFTTGPYYLDNDLNTNVQVRVPSGRSCASALPWELAGLLCDSCHADGGCGQAVLVFGDAHPGCTEQTALTFAIGAAYSSIRPWHQCAGWPQAANYANYNYLPDNYRIWLR